MIFEDDYIALIPRYSFAKKHSHFMLHLMLSKEVIEITTDKVHRGQLVVLNSFVPHSVKASPGRTVLFLFDPGSGLGEAFSKEYLDHDIYCGNLPKSVEFYVDQALEGNLATSIPKLWEALGIELHTKEKKDERIEEILLGIKDQSLLLLTVPELAEKVFLSESRLTHLFKEDTGMTLKNYLLMNRMRLAFELVLQNQSITEAAHAAGFFDSAHLANLVRKTTGINISEVMK